MKIIEVLSQIPKLDKAILLSAPKIEATPKEVSDYLNEWGISKEYTAIENAMERQKRLLNYYEKINVMLCNIQDSIYPKKLTEMALPPAVIYYRGDISGLNELKTIAVIGTRNPSPDGKKVSYSLGKVLSQKGYGVINGLALGCDTYALEGCVDSETAYPIAIMPCGLDEIYPKRNKELVEKILDKGGCLISEYEPNTTVQKYMFVQRDRIQACLSDGVIMVEAMEESGTMHTINFAQRYKKYIACYKEKSNDFTGNAYLLEHGVQALENDKDLELFEKKIKNGGFHQVSLFDEALG